MTRWQSLGARAFRRSAVALATVSTALVAQQPPAKGPPLINPMSGPSAQAWKQDPAQGLPDRQLLRFKTQRSGVFGGRPLRYSIVSEDQLIRNTSGEAIGSIFSFSYIKTGLPGEQRPVIFIFNGGPGSSSIWLHMGILGPRRIDFRDVEPSQVPPFPVVDNPDSPLAVADLVFIDPVGTGFSHYWAKGGAKDFYGREEDAAATVQFIAAWLRKHHRWESPKFLIGESYGTTRAALLTRRLMGGAFDGTLKGISLNGVVLLGGDGALANPPGNDKYLITFTTFAAAGWYHDRVDKAGLTFDRFIADADRFARTELMSAMDKWATLDSAAKEAMARKYARFTGLGIPYLLGKDLRVTPTDFEAELLRDRGLALGHYDARYVLPTQNSGGDPVADDPAMGQYTAPFVAGFNHYIRDELGINPDEDYVVIDWINVNLPFNHGSRKEAATTAFNLGDGDPGADLAAAMRRNPQLHLMTGEGWFDMFGAVGTAQYGIAQRKLPLDRVTQKAYFSGHMAYVGDAGPKLAADIKTFVLNASGIARSGPPRPSPNNRALQR